jgi:hypothetical protein
MAKSRVGLPWDDLIVPIAVEFVPLDLDLSQFGVRHLDSGSVKSLV